MNKDSIEFSKIKSTLDKVITRLNNKFTEEGSITYTVEIQDRVIEKKVKRYSIFLVKQDGDKTEILLNIPIASSKVEHRMEGYLQIITIISDLGLQSLSIMTQQALAKQKALSDTEEE